MMKCWRIDRKNKNWQGQSQQSKVPWARGSWGGKSVSEQKEPAAILIGRDTARLGGEAGAPKA